MIRVPILKKVFKNDGRTFGGMYAAETFLTTMGYSYGSTSHSGPVPICKGEYTLPEKWHNLSRVERNQVDGIMDSKDWRNGDVAVILYN